MMEALKLTGLILCNLLLVCMIVVLVVLMITMMKDRR